MAGDWIGIDHDLPSKAEVLGIHERTGEAIDTILGRLFLLWVLFDRQTEDGVLPNVGPRSIAAKCGGTPDFWEAVAAVGWLVFNDDGAIIPNFTERFGKSARRRLLEAQRKRGGRHADTKRTPCGQEADVVRTSCGQVAPQVSVSVSQQEPKQEQEPKPKPETEGSASADPCRPAVDRSADVRAVFDHYRQWHPRAHPKPKSTSKEWRAVRARLREGYEPADLCEAVDGVHKTPHNLGANDRGTKYLGLELIMRTSDQVARFIENNRDPPRPQNERERRTVEAMERWVERVTNESEEA